jgi:hypothetical protein
MRIALPLALVALLEIPALAAPASYQPLLLFMQPQDARETVGVLSFDANPLEPRGRISAAGDALQAVEGAPIASFHPLHAVPADDNGCYVFACSHRKVPGSEPRTFQWRLYRGLTPDGYRLTEWKEVFRNPDGPWLIESMLVRRGNTNELFFFTWSRHPQPEKGHAVWGFASPDGLAWRPISGEPLYLEHDAFGGMWDDRTGRFLTAQVTQQPWKKPYADNIGSDKRRVLSIRVSRDGLTWQRASEAGPDGLITPDAEDPPDIEFYRMQPFRLADRYVGIADLYAASPLTPAKHGPHLTCEWWVSADGLRWQRPWRQVNAHGQAPYALKINPMWFGKEMLFWISGQVLGLPEYRIASIGSRSNAEFSTRLFEMPSRPLLLNASIPSGNGLFNQAYVTVELRDDSGRTIPGYEHDKCILRNVDDTRIALRWGQRSGTELAGQKVSIRFRLRWARIYAVGC